MQSQEEEKNRTLLRNNSPTNPALLVRLSIVQSRPLYCLIVNFTMQSVEAGNDRSFNSIIYLKNTIRYPGSTTSPPHKLLLRHLRHLSVSGVDAMGQIDEWIITRLTL